MRGSFGAAVTAVDLGEFEEKEFSGPGAVVFLPRTAETQGIAAGLPILRATCA